MDPVTVKSIAAALLLYAQQATFTTGIPLPEPDVRFVAQAEIAANVCGNPRCKAIAGFSYDDNVIYMSNRQDVIRDMHGRSILLHEIVHHVQHHTAALEMPNQCLTWKARERQAYKIQYQWLHENRVRVATPAYNTALVNFDSIDCGQAPEA